MRKSIVFSVTATILACAALIAPAQDAPPGYLGKLNTVEYDYGAFMGYQVNVDEFRFSQNHSFQYNRVLDRRRCVGLSYTRYGIDIEAHYLHQYIYSNEVNKMNDFETKVYGTYRISGNDFGIHMRFYQDGWIAPLGVYHQFGLKAVLLKPTNNTAYYYNKEQVALEPSKPFFTSLGISYTFGTTRVLYDRLLVNCGLQLHWMASTVYPYYNEHNYQLIDTYFRRTMNRKVFFNQLIKVKLGIGLLS